MLCDIKVGLSCNNACVHCIMEPVKRAQKHSGNGLDADTDTIKGLITRAAERGFTHITLTGGEVTIRSDFPELVQFALAQNLTVVIQTNGRQLARSSRRAFLKQLANAARVQFVVALHGHMDTIHDAVTRRSGSFRQTIKGIESLRNEGFRVCGKIVISRTNLSSILETMRLLKRIGVEECAVAFPHAEDFIPSAFHKVVPTYADVAKVIGGILAVPPATLPASICYETIPYCVIPDVNFWRSSFDLIFLREKLGRSETQIEMSMTGQTIDWNMSRIEIKKKPETCGNCLLDHVCEGPWMEYAAHFGTGEFLPITDHAMVNRFIEVI
ncbi:MAG: radical SAM protein [Betaproteobacteria bacterium]